MDALTVNILVAVVAALTGLGGAAITARLAKPGSRELEMLKASLADSSSLRDEVQELRQEVAELRAAHGATSVQLSRTREYAFELRRDLHDAGCEVRPWPLGLP